MEVSIIIVNYNTCKVLCDCLQSIYIHTRDISCEIIVVDNDSQDNSRKMLTDKFPEVTLIASPENLGFGRANNLGIKHAKGEYLFFLNSDTLLLNNAVKIFHDYCLSSIEKIGALGAILKSNNGKNIHSYGELITMKSELKELTAKYLKFLKDKKKHHPDDVINAKEVGYITGAALFVPRNVYEELGGFDPRFFMYCEEVDWQCRMAEAGYKRIIIPGPEIAHLEGGSDASQSNIWSANRLECIYKSKKLYLEKYNGGIKYRMFKIAYITLQIPIELIFIKTKKMQKTTENNIIRAKPTRGFKRIWRLSLGCVINYFPLTMAHKACLYRLIGVNMGEGVLMGKIIIDGIHPEDIFIGSGTTITQGTVLLTHFYDTSNLKEHAYYRGEIHIGKNCYIGMNTIFTKSVTIGDGVVIGAGSVVNKDIPPYQVWAGVPVRFICNRYKDESEIPTNANEFKAM